MFCIVQTTSTYNPNGEGERVSTFARLGPTGAFPNYVMNLRNAFKID